MLDFARESSLDFANILYEFDDILDYDYLAAMEAENEGSTSGSDGGTSSATTQVNGTSETKPVNGSNPVSPASGTKPDDKSTTSTSPNTNLKNTMAFVSKMKALAEKLTETIRTMIQQLSEKLDAMTQENIDKFIQAANAARQKNGFNAIEVENYTYDTDYFNKGIDGVKAIMASIKNEVETICNEYDRIASGKEFPENNAITKFNATWGDNKFYTDIAAKLTLDGANADEKAIRTGFQDKFRGEKKTAAITEAEVNSRMEYLRTAVAPARELVSASNTSKDAAKKIADKLKTLTANPDTNTKVNEVFTTAMNTASKMCAFASSFWLFAYNLTREYRENCRIVIQRAYKMESKDANTKDKNANTTTTNTEAKPEEKSEENK